MLQLSTRFQPDTAPEAPGPGFTLLELLLALAIGIILLAAVYVTVVNQVELTQAGRHAIEEGQLARKLLDRIYKDISGQLPPVLPTAAANNASAMGSSSGASGSTTGGSAGATGTATASASTTTAATNSPFNLGVQGDQSTIIISGCTVPKESLKPSVLQNGDIVPGISDQRVIMWWMATDGGLARMEIKAVTSPDLLAAASPSVPDEQSHVFAKEVKSFEIQYFDGSSWIDTWDGTQPGQDGVTPWGRPS